MDHPITVEELFLLASEFAALGELDKAEAAFAKAVLLAPHMPVIRYQLGLLQFSSGRAALALLTWQPLLDLPDAQPQAQALAGFVRGYAALAQDDLALALSHFQAGLAHDVGNPALAGDVRKVIERVQALIKAPVAT